MMIGNDPQFFYTWYTFLWQIMIHFQNAGREKCQKIRIRIFRKSMYRFEINH